MNLDQKYPQILIGSPSSELALWFLESKEKFLIFSFYNDVIDLLSKYIQNNEKFHEKILKKSEKITPGIHIFDEKLSIFFFFQICITVL